MHTAQLRNFIKKYEQDVEVKASKEFAKVKAFYDALKIKSSSQDRNLSDHEKIDLFKLIRYELRMDDENEKKQEINYFSRGKIFDSFLIELDVFAKIVVESGIMYQFLENDKRRFKYRLDYCLYLLYGMNIFSHETINELFLLAKRVEDYVSEDKEVKSDKDKTKKVDQYSMLLESILENMLKAAWPFSKDKFVKFCNNSLDFFVLVANSAQALNISCFILKESQIRKDEEQLFFLGKLKEVAEKNLGYFLNKINPAEIQNMFHGLNSYLAGKKEESKISRENFNGGDSMYCFEDFICGSRYIRPKTFSNIVIVNVHDLLSRFHSSTKVEFINFIKFLIDVEEHVSWFYYSSERKKEIVEVVSNVFSETTAGKFSGKDLAILISDYSFFKETKNIVVPANNIFSICLQKDDYRRFVGEFERAVENFGAYIAQCATPILRSIGLSNIHRGIWVRRLYDDFHLLKLLKENWPDKNSQVKYISAYVVNAKGIGHTSLAFFDLELKTIEIIDSLGPIWAESTESFVKKALNYTSQDAEKTKDADSSAIKALAKQLQEYKIILSPWKDVKQQLGTNPSICALYAIRNDIGCCIGKELNKNNIEFAEDLDKKTAVYIRSLAIDFASGHGLGNEEGAQIDVVAKAVMLNFAKLQADEKERAESKGDRKFTR